MSDNLIQISELADTEISLLPEAEKLRKQLLDQARTVESVADAFESDCAADVLKNISTAVKDMEAARKEVKAPVLELGRRIDAVAKDWLSDLETEKKRINRTLGDYQAEQDRIRREAERAAIQAREEAQKKAEDALDAGDENRAKKILSESYETTRAEVSQSAHRPEGVSVRTAYKFEVTDINALYDAAPHLCKVEPDNAAIRAAIKKDQSIPGLRVWKESSAVTR